MISRDIIGHFPRCIQIALRDFYGYSISAAPPISHGLQITKFKSRLDFVPERDYLSRKRNASKSKMRCEGYEKGLLVHYRTLLAWGPSIETGFLKGLLLFAF